jgi:hypothetical protein
MELGSFLPSTTIHLVVTMSASVPKSDLMKQSSLSLGDCTTNPKWKETLITLSKLAGRRGRLVDFVKLGLEADRTVIDFSGDRLVGYHNGLLLHIT